MQFDWLHCLTSSPDFFRIQPFLLLRTSLTSFQLGKRFMTTLPVWWFISFPISSGFRVGDRFRTSPASLEPPIYFININFLVSDIIPPLFFIIEFFS